MIHAIHTPQKIRLVLPPVYPWIDILSKASWRGGKQALAAVVIFFAFAVQLIPKAPS
jgi:hypothetical protein